MDIYNDSEFSIDEITSETVKVLRLGGKSLIIYLLTCFCAVLFTIGFMIYSIVDGKSVQDIIVILICLVIILGLLLYFKFGYPKSIKKQYEKNFGGNIIFHYTFHINRVDVESTSPITNSKATFTYESLNKIVEGPTMLRLYIAKRNFLPVRKDAFSESDYIKINKVISEAKVKHKIVKR